MSPHHERRGKLKKSEKLTLLDRFEEEQLGKIRKDVQIHKICKRISEIEDTVEDDQYNIDMLWENEDCVDKLRINALALQKVYCALSMERIYQFITCETAKELWDSLKEAYGGSHREITLLLRHISPKELEDGQLGDSINEPPILSHDGCHFGYWKARMRVYIKSNDPLLWYIIENGPLKIMKPGENGVLVEKHKNEYDENDYIKLSKNARAKLMLLYGLRYDRTRPFSSAKTAKELWEALNDMYEGNDDRKQVKICLLETEYESFKLIKGESISQMFDRFYTIVGQLALLGEEVTMRAKVRKILRSLPEEYEILVAKIKFLDVLSGLSLNDLYSLVLAREEQIKISQ